MKEVALELLNIIYEYGYEAYIVGGFVRNMLLGLNSKDIDITTNATPMELKNIFHNIKIPNKNYGSVTLIYKGERFEITTYREESGYTDNRHPSTITYVNDLKKDLLRRDFTVNTICLNKDGEIIDLLDGKRDLNRKIINTIIDSEKSFNNDCLRILRAIRFATILNFTLSDSIIDAIKKTKPLLKKLSSERKKQELDYIFVSPYAKEGITLIKKLDLIEELDLDNIDRVHDYSDLIGIWSMINSKTYSFSSSENDLIKKVNIVYEMNNLDKWVLFKYGLYVNVLAGINKGIDKKLILQTYNELPIETRMDIKINAQEICTILDKKAGKFINDIYEDLEKKIIDDCLDNNRECLTEYIKKNYKE